MQKIKKLFGGVSMTWPRVLILALVTAVYTAAVNLIPALNDTSFQDIAVIPDAWFLFALFIIVNCEKWWEASLKCFVFFLVSQPLIYLLEVPFNELGFGIFMYYGYWFRITLLTLPGAAAAFLVKKKNWSSVAVLSAAAGYLAVSGAIHFRAAVWDFPRHLLTAVFALALAVFFIFVLLDEKKHRIAALAIVAVILIAALLYFFASAGSGTTLLSLPEGEWTVRIENPELFDVEIRDGHIAELHARKKGSGYVWFTEKSGEEREYYVTSSNGKLTVNSFD